MKMKTVLKKLTLIGIAIIAFQSCSAPRPEIGIQVKTQAGILEHKIQPM